MRAIVVAAGLLTLGASRSWAADWSVYSEQAYFSRTILACVAFASGQGDVSIELAIDRSRADVLSVSFIAPGNFKSAFPIANYTLTASFPDGKSLPLSGRGGITVVDLNAFTGFISSTDLPAWVHEMTATSGMTLSGGPLLRPLKVSLVGSSAGVDGIEKCVRSAKFGGVSLPFRADAGTSTPIASAQCLEYGQRVTLSGTVVDRPNHAPNNDAPTFPALLISQPICTTRFGMDRAESDQKYIEIETGQADSSKAGRKVTLTGIIRHQFSKVENGPLILGVSGG